MAYMGRLQFTNEYEDIISAENLLKAWKEFLCGKRSHKDVQQFELNLMANILTLYQDLANKTYQHSPYQAFNISDPKPRNIHKASVRDRLLHHAIYRILYPFFDKTFIADSYSCRLDKGTHKAISQFRNFAYKASFNHTRTVWVLKCDIKKFFASINQAVLFEIISCYISDVDIRWLIFKIVSSFNSTEKGRGLPLGNLTSQLLVNVYMNEFDQFVKHQLKVKYYIRYADDFVFLSDDKIWLQNTLLVVRNFLMDKLRLELHPDKLFIKTITSGVDFLGWVHFFDHRILRTATKRRMLRNVQMKEGNIDTVQSYLGLLSHGNAKKLVNRIRNIGGQLF
ncbi:MAG: hypothetical protein A2744_02245 [Candidatus Buchananbacteria bacterium RIFCSPHIGHO2_01_FULL_44_11]|uniref:Reverse transcriptase domain-containing protein n=1 Tax=Candidatus Buchananbacteria bacterium RIFCSPHIGHO2_01_FULL_44_11 TaxID=1797535 RepID=A0A1G1Y0W6_9BACT|nr:MAG: hypothetical protein A2744_02245 [Candidatus Buchananbacteria bacterium RIFCSPHIGHO2_01_FULL_44_11]